MILALLTMATDSEVRAWARRQGMDVKERGRAGARLRAAYEQAHPAAAARRGSLPPPGDPVYATMDVGELIPDPDPPSSPPSAGPVLPGDDPGAADFGGGGAGNLPADEPDQPPAHSTRDWKRGSKGASAKPKAQPGKVTAPLRRDITGQIGFLLQMPAAVWAARDPLCGGAFLEQLEPIADALTDWVVDSPSLLALFTGPAGSFAAKAVKTLIAVAPVASVMSAHHVYHSIELPEPDGQPQPGPARYAA